jgi:hypothetical protein
VLTALAICKDDLKKHPYEIPFLWNAMIAARRRSPEMLAVVSAIIANVQVRPLCVYSMSTSFLWNCRV